MYSVDSIYCLCCFIYVTLTCNIITNRYNNKWNEMYFLEHSVALVFVICSKFRLWRIIYTVFSIEALKMWLAFNFFRFNNRIDFFLFSPNSISHFNVCKVGVYNTIIFYEITMFWKMRSNYIIEFSKSKIYGKVFCWKVIWNQNWIAWKSI